MAEEYSVVAGGVTYQLHTLSGFALMHNLGGLTNGQTKTTGEIYRDLLYASLISPKLTKKEIETTIGLVAFKQIGTEILMRHQVDVQDFHDAVDGKAK